MNSRTGKASGAMARLTKRVKGRTPCSPPRQDQSVLSVRAEHISIGWQETPDAQQESRLNTFHPRCLRRILVYHGRTNFPTKSSWKGQKHPAGFLC
ncbi:hypothetical protein ElyMa_006688500 [Elysia marginata]|uniref:Uncharacterized protein n=1 Tax=Elysia marginata TaxID=1093978 RepID=A0AAV4IS56_9GAST|nr:hypothetical protein ElyMa_006688500 [Elysia marginata]